MLSVFELKVNFKHEKTIIPALTNVSFDLQKGQTLGILGESGSGKSVLAKSIMRLISGKNAKIKGRVVFNGTDIYSMNSETLRLLRGKKIAMVYQNPFLSLDPLWTIGFQIEETYPDKKKHIQTMLNAVGLDAKDIYKKYPHQLSGGMLQRVMICLAALGNPDIIIADEPTSALDKSTQDEIIKLFKNIKDKLNISMIFISHDIEVLKDISDKILVMYKGYVLEEGFANDIITSPMHPYTQGLINSVITLETKRGEAISLPEGNMGYTFDGCPFYDRCAKKISRCEKSLPLLRKINTRSIRCHLFV